MHQYELTDPVHTFNRRALVLLPRSKVCNKKSAQLLATKVI